MPSHFLVQRNDLTSTRVDAYETPPLNDGEVVIQVEQFALTANNITYGVAGDIIGYWQFFPAADGWGRIPVWGIGKVTASQHEQVAVGQRFYGYFPMSSDLTVVPAKVNPQGFRDAAAHRAELPPVYNQYTLVSEATGFLPQYDQHAMVYRPLFTTSFVLDDYLADNDMFGAEQIILGSASSKTAFGLAYMLKQRTGIKVVGLTSAGNREFVGNLGLYDQTLTYDEVSQLAQIPSGYVDMAGNRDVLAQVHHHLNEQLTVSCGVGITHWEARDGAEPASLPGAKPSMFFAPSQIMKRHEELGPERYQSLLADATAKFFADVDNWVTIETHSFTDIDNVYNTVLNGPPANRAFVVSVD